MALSSSQKSRSNTKSRFRLGLFSRSFLLLAGLMLVSLGAWLQVFFSMEEGPRATQMAQRVTTAVSITRSALVYAPTSVRPALLLDLATQERLRVQDRQSVVKGTRVEVSGDIGGRRLIKKKTIAQ